jgi:diaminopimelate epimerase
MTGTPIPFVKGHGTGNDFVILSNLDGALDVTPALVAALCDRRRGLGGDGVLVVARTAEHPEVADQAGVAPYFMDYRNADGSLAQMCGNGARVFVAHLLEAGLVSSGRFQIATRGGVRRVRVSADDDSICVDMGPAEVLDRADIVVLPVDAPPGTAASPATGVLMPNPHAVVAVADVAAAGRLIEAPMVTPDEAFPEGVNVEFVRVIDPTHIQMRVFERGVGETLSCGTGACAAAVATLHLAGERPADQRVRVDVPGGTVHVVRRSGGEVELHGPAVLVARGTIDQSWWEAHV